MTNMPQNFEFRRSADKPSLTRDLEAAGYIVWEVDIRALKSSLEFIARARQVLPLDPPLCLGNSLDAFVDSFSGGMYDLVLASTARSFAVLLTHADAVLEQDPALLVEICTALSDAAEGDCDPGEEFTLLVLVLGEGVVFGGVNQLMGWDMWPFKRKKSQFLVFRVGRGDALLCREGDRSMVVLSERLIGGEYDLVVYLDSIRTWNPPHEHVPVTRADKQRIEQSLRTALSKDRVLWK